MQFTVTIYHGDDQDEDVPLDDDTLIHSASLIGSLTVSANDEQEAAAKAWIQVVGRAREEFLKELSAPAVIIAHETKLEPSCANCGLRRSAWRCMNCITVLKSGIFGLIQLSGRIVRSCAAKVSGSHRTYTRTRKAFPYRSF